jgi:hypothetical protein
MFEYYIPEDYGSAFKYLTPSYNLVTENPRKKTNTKVPLAYKDCSEVTFRGEKIKYSHHCMPFSKTTKIGGNWRDGTKQYIEVTVMPCTVDCDLYLNDPDYVSKISELFYYSASTFKFLDSIS